MALAAEILVKIRDEASASLNSIKASLNAVETSSNSLESSLGKMTSALAAVGLGVTIKATIDYVDTIQTLDNKLRLVTNSSGELNSAYQRLYQVAQDTRAPLNETVNLYSKLALNQEAAGLAGVDLYKVTEAFNKTLAISGATGAAAASSLYQFAQAMQSGRLQGDEFRTMAEANPRFLKLISEQTGIATGELKKLASEGFLNAKIIGIALEQGLKDLNDQFDRMPKTVGQALTQLSNAFQKSFKEFLDSSGAADLLVKAISHITDNIDNLIPILKVAGIVVGGLLVYFNPLTAAFVAGAAAIVYFADVLGPLAKSLLKLLGDAFDIVSKKAVQFGSAIKALINLDNPFEAFTKAGEDYDEQMQKTIKTTGGLNAGTKDLSGTTKTGTVVTKAMNDAMNENGLNAKRNTSALDVLIASMKNKIIAAGLDQEESKKQIFVYEELEKIKAAAIKSGKVMTDAEIANAKQRIGQSYDELIAAKDVTDKRKQMTDDFYAFIKANQTKSLTDVDVFNASVEKADAARRANSKISEDDYNKYLDTARKVYSDKYVKLIENQALTGLTTTQQYSAEIQKLEADRDAGRLSASVNFDDAKRAIDNKYSKDYVKLIENQNLSNMTANQKYAAEIAKLEADRNAGMLDGTVKFDDAKRAIDKKYSEDYFKLSEKLRLDNMTNEQAYNAKILEFQANKAAQETLTEEQKYLILDSYRKEYVNKTVSEYSTLYDMLGEKLQGMLGISKEKFGLMTEVSKLFGFDTKAILKDAFAQGIQYLLGFTNPGGSAITSLAQLVGTQMKTIPGETQGAFGSSQTIIGSFVNGSLGLFKSFGSGLINVFKGAGDYIWNSLLPALGQVVVRAADAVSSLFNVNNAASSGGGSGGGGFWSTVIDIGSSILGWFFEQGGVIDQQQKIVKRYASGGIVSKPTLFPMAEGAGLMGESGPEAIMPLTRGSDGALGVKMPGGGGGGININFTINATDAKGIDTLLIERKSLITNIVRSAVAERGGRL